MRLMYHNVCCRWSIVAVKELAGTLALTDEANWKHFASYIGFTNQEWIDKSPVEVKNLID